MPRTAWRVRWVFSINAKRTWPSPVSPKPMPAETATPASFSSRLENSREPISRKGDQLAALDFFELLADLLLGRAVNPRVGNMLLPIEQMIVLVG